MFPHWRGRGGGWNSQVLRCSNGYPHPEKIGRVIHTFVEIRERAAQITHSSRVNKNLELCIRNNSDLATHAALVRVSSSATLRWARQRSKVSQPYRGVFSPPTVDLPQTKRAQAALLSLGGQAMLSHQTALQLWGIAIDSADVHVLIEHSRRVAKQPGVHVHRTRHYPEAVGTRCGLRCQTLEQALVATWVSLAADPSCPPEHYRGPLIQAIQSRLTTPARLVELVEPVRRLPRRHQLLRLLTTLSQGCHSELEIWGYEKVFTSPLLPRSVAQLQVKVNGRTCYLDRYFPTAWLNVELDGAAWHGDDFRERDIKRDSALACKGVQVMRFSGSRLRREPDLVRLELIEVIRQRETLLRHLPAPDWGNIRL